MRFLLISLMFCSMSLTALEVRSTDGVFQIQNIPHVKQKTDFCGEACVEMFFKASKIDLTQDDVFDASGLDPKEGRGCYAPDLFKGLQKLGVNPGKGWFAVKVADQKTELMRLWNSVLSGIKSGVPSIVCTRYSNKPESSEHFRLIVGYDSVKKEVIYHEPALDNSPYLRMKLDYFLEIWPLKYSKDTWTVVSFMMNQVSKPKALKDEAFTDADYAQHIIELKKKLPKGFSFVIQKPFVVIGNNHEKIVKQWATGVVSWTVDKIKKQYFKKDPKFILDVWLFKDKQSYEFYNRKLFGGDPGTPFGYYSSSKRSLVMNISTGGGTLVHEIVHPFMESNFPNCPSWFNEGLASLYEQSAEKNGKIVGLTNWRLSGLKKEITAGTLPTFKELCSTTTNEFYNSAKGNNYAQARYLCYYLQENDLLEQYYKDFTANVKEDPTGYKTLVKALKVEDMKAFQQKWQKWVMGLKR